MLLRRKNTVFFPSGRRELNENRLREWKYEARAKIFKMSRRKEKKRTSATNTDCSENVIRGTRWRKRGLLLCDLSQMQSAGRREDENSRQAESDVKILGSLAPIISSCYGWLRPADSQ